MIAPPYGQDAHAIRSASNDRAWKLRIALFVAQQRAQETRDFEVQLTAGAGHDV